MENQKESQAKDKTTRVQTGSRSDLQSSNAGKRRRTRSSRSEHQRSEEGHLHVDPATQGVVGEKVWFNRNVYEKADDAYQTLLSSGCSVPPVLSFSKDRVPRTLVFRAKRNAGQRHQEEENPHPRFFTSQQQQRASTRHRSSSEPQRGRRAPNSRKRVYSETEHAPQRRDKYG